MITHPELVKRLAKSGEVILKELTPEDCHLWHMASCIPSEAGELFDAVKKQVIYRKSIDRLNVLEELGDLEFYLEGLRQALAITREEVLAANINKLSERYKNLEYSNMRAQKREDKLPPPANQVFVGADPAEPGTDKTAYPPGHPNNPLKIDQSPRRRNTVLPPKYDDGLEPAS
jgi:NTP pyrophosphatase (non-canonical NTP hydrolase)